MSITHCLAKFLSLFSHITFTVFVLDTVIKLFVQKFQKYVMQKAECLF